MRNVSKIISSVAIAIAFACSLTCMSIGQTGPPTSQEHAPSDTAHDAAHKQAAAPPASVSKADRDKALIEQQFRLEAQVRQLVEQGKYAEANEALTKLTDQTRQFLDAVQSGAASGKGPGAVKARVKMIMTIEGDPRQKQTLNDDYTRLNERVTYLQSHGKPLDAIKYCDELLKLTKGYDAITWGRRAQCNLQLMRYREAIHDLTEGISLSINDDDDYLTRAYAYFKLGEYGKGIADCTQSIQINPNNPKAYYNRGQAYALLGDKNRAHDDLSRAAAMGYDPVVDRLLQDAETLISHGQTRDALLTLHKAIDLNPHNAHSYELRGSLLYSAEVFDRARIDFIEAARLHGETATDDHNLAAISMRMKDFGAAVKYLTRQLQSNKSDSIIYGTRAQCYEELGQLDLALADYTSALKLNSTDQIYRVWRAHVLVKLGQNAEAAHECTSAIAQDPNWEEPYLVRAEAEENLGSSAEVERDYERCLELVPSDQRIYAKRANYHSKIGRSDLAQSDLQKARHRGQTNSSSAPTIVVPFLTD